MAYDKIITIHSRLDRRINYALNPAKTRNGERVLCAALNCQLDTSLPGHAGDQAPLVRKTALFRAIYHPLLCALVR